MLRESFNLQIIKENVMSKKLVLFGAFVSAFLLASCSSGNKKAATPVSETELENASEVINYYNTSISVLKNTVKERDVNAVLGYMEQKGKVPAIPAIVPPAVSVKDTAELMNPGDYFNEETQQDLVQNYAGLFNSRAQFYANFDTYLAYLKTKNSAKADKLLNVNYQLSLEMSEYKQNILDILSPFTEQAEQVLLADNPLKDHIMAMRKMSASMQSIIDLYARKHTFDQTRIELRMEELTKQLDAAKKLPAMAGNDQEMKAYQNFLTKVDQFLKDMRKAREKGGYTEYDYDMMSSEYGISII